MKVWKQRSMSWGSDCVSLLKSRNIRRSDADKEFLHRTAQCVLRPVQIEWRCVTADSLMGGLGLRYCFLMATSSVSSGGKEIRFYSPLRFRRGVKGKN